MDFPWQKKESPNGDWATRTDLELLEARLVKAEVTIQSERLAMAELHDKVYHLYKRIDKRVRDYQRLESPEIAEPEPRDPEPAGEVDSVTARVLARRRGHGVSPVTPG